MKFKENYKLSLTYEESLRTYFTSDLHFGHRNIMVYCDRPFESVEEMDEQLIQNYNSVVPEDGIVINSGDLTFYRSSNSDKVKYILSRLNGTMYLVPGNHDYAWLLEMLKGVPNVIVTNNMLEMSVKTEDEGKTTQNISVCHYPMISWNHSHKGAWQLYGHHHGSYSEEEKDKLDFKQIEIGADCWKYFPISYEQVSHAIGNQFMHRHKNDK